MIAVQSLENACSSLDYSIRNRLGNNPPSEDIEQIKYPVGLFFLRGDRGGFGKEIVEQVVASYSFWNEEAGKYFDMIFPGWGKDGNTAVYLPEAFIRCKKEFEDISKWKYSGEADILLLNYDFEFKWNGRHSFYGNGRFNFDETIVLPMELMISEGKVSSLDKFMQELINCCKENSYRSDSSVLLKIRDKVAMPKGKDAMFAAIRSQFLKGYSKIYDELRPYAVCNLSQ
ncbi:MAG: hypothetical protein HY863_05400 [Chloroflexi bacterium]|nr:hypothetical protein [Chloroflexota bacterium]